MRGREADRVRCAPREKRDERIRQLIPLCLSAWPALFLRSEYTRGIAPTAERLAALCVKSAITRAYVLYSCVALCIKTREKKKSPRPLKYRRTERAKGEGDGENEKEKEVRK